jgi:hypothetical protein
MQSRVRNGRLRGGRPTVTPGTPPPAIPVGSASPRPPPARGTLLLFRFDRRRLRVPREPRRRANRINGADPGITTDPASPLPSEPAPSCAAPVPPPARDGAARSPPRISARGDTCRASALAGHPATCRRACDICGCSAPQDLCTGVRSGSGHRTADRLGPTAVSRASPAGAARGYRYFSNHPPLPAPLGCRVVLAFI